MGKYSESQINEAKLARAVFDLAADYKADSQLMCYLSYISSTVGDLLKATDENRSSLIDWSDIANYFDMLEFQIKDGVDISTQKPDVERLVDKILFDAEHP